MKEIWKEFKEKTKVAWTDFVNGVKVMAKATFKILKEDCKVFVVAVFKWIWEVLKGFAYVAKAFVEVVWAALVAAIKATFGWLYAKCIDWIDRW